MTKHIKRKLAQTKKHPILGKLALLLAIILILKLSSGLGAEAAAENMLKNLAANSETVTDILDMELGGQGSEANAISLLASQSTLMDEITSITLSQDDGNDADEQPDTVTDPPPAADVIETDTVKQTSGFYEYSLDPDSIKIKNKTSYDIDLSSLLADDLDIHIDPTSPQVLIVHTHGSEAYYPDGDDVYVASDPSRTEDKNYNVVRVGDRLAELLEERGISVLHDRELYDYPSYTGSYNRSMESIEQYLEEYPDIKVVIDLHRDALEESDGTIHRTSAEINGEVCSQVLLIVGSNYSGLDHPNWQENLKFACHIQADMDEKYPGLTRPVTISQYRYNQHATTGSLIAEIGCTGNTLQESLKAVEHFADCLSDVLLRYGER